MRWNGIPKSSEVNKKWMSTYGDRRLNYPDPISSDIHTLKRRRSSSLIKTTKKKLKAVDNKPDVDFNLYRITKRERRKRRNRKYQNSVA